MDSKTFATIIRKVIREEIRMAIKQELTEILQEGLQTTINEMKGTSKPVSKTVMPPRKKSNAVFTDTPFADILNETEPLRENQPMSNFRDIMSEGMDEIRMTSRDAMGFGAMRQNMMQPTATPKVMEDPETGKVYEVKPEVAAAMTRDYSALMKAIDAKKGR
jgi:hypothetical protein